ncbi:DUF7507 domain-containing protein [Wenzhouxiangella marina]|uniref:DUF7507 domain-containing protein n=1 Tax=Wenzhouxiangella marina TaxID=1579979 RepID=UPI0006737527|nr:DUF11 domain-containing protein [Wenzhouxiangella marina]MBB6086711.1 putative repeat protein (TIGR01451 family)/putative delta-60 repeat protein [Wenzhouxiangella marina]
MDPDFGTGGVAVVGAGNGTFASLTIDGAGDVVAAGFTGGFHNGNFFVARFSDTGVLGDTASTSFVANPGNGHNAQAVVVDNSGRFVVVGSVNGRAGDAEMGVARYDSGALALDPAFDTDGLLELDLAADDRANDVAVDGSNRIVLAGTSANTATVVRLTDAGALDPAFDADGVLTVPGVVANAVAVDGSGRILVASNSSADGNSNILVSRYDSAGVPDAGFGAAGTATIDLGGKEHAFDLTVDGSGRIIVVGSGGEGSTADFLVARLTDAGALDNSFAGTGVASIDITGGADVAYGVDLASDGSILVGGSAGGNTGVAKLLDNGTLDAGFGTGGIVDLDSISGSLDAGFDLVVDALDRVLVAGHVHNGFLGHDMMVVRLQGGGNSVDLSITKDDGVADVTAGTSTIYTIVAANAGPSDAIAATVTDTFPVACDSVSWSCVAAGGATCTAGPVAGDINDVINLPAGGSATYTATCAVSAAASGSLVNTASITAPGDVVDIDPLNDSATDTNSISVDADLAISKTNGTAASVPGSDTVYTIVASNSAGPSDIVGATVTDNFPAACTSVSWSCVAAGGATCTAGPGVGNIADVIDLPVGSSATYTATCSIDAAAVGTLDNTATVSAPMGATDPVAVNNSATDSDTLGASADLSMSKQAVSVPDPLQVGSTIQYELIVSNAGPSTATDVVVTDAIPANLTYASDNCGASVVGTDLVWNVGSLASGNSASCLVDFVVADAGPIVNTATVSSSSSDPNGANDTGSSQLAGVALGPMLPVPTLGWQALALLMMLMAALGTLFVRRHA